MPTDTLSEQQATDIRVKALQQEDIAAGLAPRCPHCAGKYRSVLRQRELGWLHEQQVRNPTSRRDNQYICWACGRAEAIADMTDITDSMARVVVETDRQEAMRLPEGIIWGNTKCPTGGFDEWSAELDRRYDVIIAYRTSTVILNLLPRDSK